MNNINEEGSTPKWLSRTASLIGAEAVERLRESSVLVFGAGGVGGYIIEALARAGIGRIGIVDHDVIDVTNLNRQLLALIGNIGCAKADCARERILSINPDCDVRVYRTFADEGNISGLLEDFQPDFVSDAIDTVSAKLALICECSKRGVRIISCMGTGNRLDPSRFEIADIEKTSGCPLARVMRRELRQRGVRGVPVLYSTEEAASVSVPSEHGRHSPASISFAPGAAGLMIAGYIIRTLIGEGRD